MTAPNHYADVAAFNDVAGVYRVPYFGAAFPPEELKMRRALVSEEYAELLAAIAADDRVEIADACADLAYVAMGWLWASRRQPKCFIPWETTPENILKCLAQDVSAVMKTNEPLFVSFVFDSALALGFAHGFQMDEIWNEVQRSNMSKIVDGKIIRRPDGKILKPPGWMPPDVRGILERAGAK